MSSDGSSEWLVEGADGVTVGPLSTRQIAAAILSGKLPYSVRVAAPQSGKWLHAVDVPFIARILDNEPTEVNRSSQEAPPMSELLPETKDAESLRTLKKASPLVHSEHDLTPKVVTPRVEATPETMPAGPGYQKFDNTVPSPGTKPKKSV